LIGDGMKRAYLEQRITDLKINNVLLLPPVSKHEARGFINAADLCLVTLKDIPLFKGAIPTKLLDYMACGRPVLCGVEGEAADIVQEAQAGIAFQPNSSQQLTTIIAELMDNEPLRSKMGRSGAQYVKNNFDAVQSRAAMTALLEAVSVG
jgi:glycosyltransferase involved in cell wall biosynthesis